MTKAEADKVRKRIAVYKNRIKAYDEFITYYFNDFCRIAAYTEAFWERSKVYCAAFNKLGEPLQFYIGSKAAGKPCSRYANEIREKLSETKFKPIGLIAEEQKASSEVLKSTFEKWEKYDLLHDFEFVINSLFALFSGEEEPANADIINALEKAGLFVKFYNDFDGEPRAGTFEIAENAREGMVNLPGIFREEDGELILYGLFRGSEIKKAEGET